MHTEYLSNILPDVYFHLRKHLATDSLTMKAVKGPDEGWTISFLNRAQYKASALTLHVPPKTTTRKMKATWDDVLVRIHLEGISEAANKQVEYKLSTQVRSLTRASIGQHLQDTMGNLRAVSIDSFNLATRRNLDPEPMWAYDVVAPKIRDLPSNNLKIDSQGNISFRLWGIPCQITFQLERMRATVDGKPMLSTLTNDMEKLSSFVTNLSNPFVENWGWNNADMEMRDVQRKIRSKMPWKLVLENSTNKGELNDANQRKLESLDDIAPPDHTFNQKSLTITQIDKRLAYKWDRYLDSVWNGSDLYLLQNDDMKIGFVGVQNGCINAYHFFKEGRPSDAAWASVEQMAREKKFHVVQNPRFTGGFIVDAKGSWHREGEIPDGSTFSNSLVLSGFKDCSLPDDLTVVGSLTLGLHYKQLPNRLNATVLDVSKSSVEVIPGDCRVTRLRASDSKIRTVCDGFTASYVGLSGTRDLESLPDNFETTTINLNDSGIQKLDNLKTDNIYLMGSSVTEISDTVFLRGNPLNKHDNILGSTSSPAPSFSG